MKNPGFITNGTIVVLKPSDSPGRDNTNQIAVVVGRYENVVEGYPEYVALPIVYNPDEDDDKRISYLTSNSTMYSFFSVFEDEVLSIIGNIDNIDKYEWVITRTINHSLDEKRKEHSTVVKLEETLMNAVQEKNFTKFKWIINNTKFDPYTLHDWISNLNSKKDFYIEYFGVKDKDIENCLSKLEKQLV